MLSLWRRAFSLAVLFLNVTHIGAFNLSSIEGNANQLIDDLEDDFGKFEQDVVADVSHHLDNSHGVLAQFNMGYETTPPISTLLKSSGVQGNVTVGLYCESCSNTTQPAAFEFASQSYSGYNNSGWLGFALDSFEALFEVDIELSAVASGDFTLSLLKQSAVVDGIAVEVDFQLYLVADASASMSFTTGLNLTLNHPAAIMMPALDSVDPVVQLNESQRIGFDQESFSLQPIFNASIPQLDFSLQFSLRTVFSVAVEEINIGSLNLDLPAFNLTVNTVSNALVNCQPVPAGERPSSNDVYAELIQVNGAFVAELSYELLDGTKTGILDHWTVWDEWNDCFAFFPGLGSVGPVPPSSQAPNLTAAAITTCVTGGGPNTTTGTAAVGAALKSLGPGAKAGAVIGTLAGVAIVAALAWYGGRASMKHSMNNDATASAWTIPRPRSGKFFSRGNRGKTTEFSPVTPHTPAWQVYQGSGAPNKNAEVQQQQFMNQGWQMAKKEPFVSVNEAGTPTPTYVSIGDDYGMPNPMTREAEAEIYDIGWQPAQAARYEPARAGQAEGLGLLQSGARPVVQRKEVSRKEIPRKSVPGYGNGSGNS